MECNFVGRNIDLEKLANAIAKYLEEEGFSVTINREDKVTLLLARGKIEDKVRQTVVKLFGDPNDFTVSFSDRQKLDPVFYSSTFWQFFGAGFLLREKYREMDFYRLMEDKFWRKVEEIINHNRSLNPSSSHP